MSARILVGDCRARLRELDAESVQTCVTSPPYWGLRDYGVAGQLGLEATPDEFVEKLVGVFRDVRRVLRADGTLWLNLGDTYMGGRSGGMGQIGITSGRNHEAARAAWLAQGGRKHRHAEGLKPKDLVGIPWMVAFALRADGWWLRMDNIWNKPNPMPESVTDRPTKAHEYMFLLSKSETYFYDQDAIREPLSPKTHTTYGSRRLSKGTDGLGGVKSDNFARDVPERRPRLLADGSIAGANKRSVWTVATQPFDGSHFATFSPKLIEPCILAGSPRGGVVLDPFNGAGTTGLVALRNERSYVGIELNPAYAEMSERRLRADAPLLDEVRVEYPAPMEVAE